MKKLILLILLILSIDSISQNYTSYFTGNNNDVYRETNGGVCLMGGALKLRVLSRMEISILNEPFVCGMLLSWNGKIQGGCSK